MKITTTSTILAALLLGLAHRTSAQDDCTQCDDLPTPKMEEKGQTCADAQNTIQNNCNGSDNWTKKMFCRYTCSVNGLGYEDEEPCCADGPSDGEQAATAAPTAAGTTAVTDSGTEGATTEATGSKETLEPTATATGTTDEPTATATGPKFTDEPTATASGASVEPTSKGTGTGTEPTAAPVEAVVPPIEVVPPVEVVPTSEPIATPEPTAGNATGTPEPTPAETSAETSDTIFECPGNSTLDSFFNKPSGEICALCVAPVVVQDNSTGTVMEAQEDCVAICDDDSCDFVPEDCGVVICPEVSPTPAPTVKETAAPTTAPTEGTEPTDAPSVMGPTSAAEGRTSSVMAVTAVVAAATLLWA